MNQGSSPWALISSVLLHIALVGVLWWAALTTKAPVITQQQPPLAIELWSGSAAPEPETVPLQPTPPPKPVEEVRPAEVHMASEPVKAKPKKEEPPPKPAPEPVKKLLNEAIEKAKAKELPKTKPVQKKAVDNPAQKPKPHSVADDLLADLGPAAAKPGKDKQTQAGAKHGVEGGSSKGSGSVSGYDSKVRAKIRPLVRIPDDISGNPTAIVRVTLFPSLQLNQVVLVKSSGNIDYDNAVMNAVKDAGTFPPLLPGLTFDEVRTMTLRFRPQD